MSVAAAAGGGLGFLGSLLGGIFGGNARLDGARKAAESLDKYGKQAVGQLQNDYYKFQNLFQPYQQAGFQGLGSLMDLLGLGGGVEYIDGAKPYEPATKKSGDYEEMMKIKGLLEGKGPGAAQAAYAYLNNGAVFDQTGVDAQKTLEQTKKQLEEKLRETRGSGPINYGERVKNLQNYYEQNTRTITPEEAQKSAIDQIQNDPLFQEQLRMGEEALLRNASATGGLRGGNLQRSLAQFAPGMLNQAVQQRLQQLSNLTGLGMNASQNIGQGIGSIGGNIASSYLNMGQNMAQNAAAAAGIKANMIQSPFNAIGNLGGELFGAGLDNIFGDSLEDIFG